MVRRNMHYSDKRINKRVVENEETEMGEKSPFPSHWPHHIAEEQDIKKKKVWEQMSWNYKDGKERESKEGSEWEAVDRQKDNRYIRKD